MLVLSLALALSFSARSQTPEVIKANKEYAKRKQQMKKAAETDQQEKIKQHLDRQTKPVRERLKKSNESTDYHYRKRERRFFFKDLFNPNKHRKRKK